MVCVVEVVFEKKPRRAPVWLCICHETTSVLEVASCPQMLKNGMIQAEGSSASACHITIESTKAAEPEGNHKGSNQPPRCDAAESSKAQVSDCS